MGQFKMVDSLLYSHILTPMQKSFFRSKLLLVVVVGASLSACANPAHNTSSSIEIQNGEMTMQQNGSNTLNSNSSNPSNGNVLGDVSQNNQPVVSQKGPTMKTIADFSPIEASQATLHTSKGDITFELYREKAPLTTLNFLNLAKEGYYDGVVFHRIIEDFMAQVGDPKTKDPSLKAEWGTGGPGYTIADEFGEGLSHDDAGVVSMANAGPNTGGSQFFITFGPTEWLDGKHAIFGKVTAGMDVLNQLEMTDTINSVSFE